MLIISSVSFVSALIFSLFFVQHTTVDSQPKGPNLASILEQNSLDEFVQYTKLSQKNFEVERGASVVMGPGELLQGSKAPAMIQ